MVTPIWQETRIGVGSGYNLRLWVSGMAKYCGLLLWLILAGSGVTQAAAPPVLRAGLNVTHWFRFPPRPDPKYLCCYLTPATLRTLRTAGFRFLRLPVQPALMRQPGGAAALQTAIHTIVGAGLAVIVVPAPMAWDGADPAADTAKLIAFWRIVAPRLEGFDPAAVFCEAMNEPVLNREAAWPRIQRRILKTIRRRLPRSTVILTGADWGSIDGLLKLAPVADPNVLYSIHVYDPAVLTSLAAFDPALDKRVLARLQFPVTSVGACDAIAGTDPQTAAVVRYYCASRWTAATLAASIARAGTWAQHNHASILVGEFGASSALNHRARLAWLAAARSAFAANGFGWALWGYDDPMGLDVSPLTPNPPTLDTGLLIALGVIERK